MNSDALVRQELLRKKDCRYCSQKINPEDEQYHEGGVYHKACIDGILLRQRNPDVFKDVSDIRIATEILLNTSESFRVNNSLRIKIIRRAIEFLLPSKGHNRLNKEGMAYRG